jgi:hypothetical protein
MSYNFNLPLLGNVTNEKPPEMPKTNAPDLGALLNQALAAVKGNGASKTNLSNMESGHTSLEDSAAPVTTSGLPDLNWKLIGLIGGALLVLFMILRR